MNQDNLIVSLIMSVRAEYMHEPHFQPLKHWDQLSTRLTAAARTTCSIAEFVTSFRRGLRITSSPKQGLGNISRYLQLSFIEDELEFHRKIESESAFLMALARVQAEEDKEKKAASKKSLNLDFGKE